MSKADLLQQMHDARAEWDEVVDRIPDERMEDPDVVGHWPARIVLAHVMSFERWTAAQIHAGLRGTPATAFERYDTDDIPPGIEEADQEEFNAAVEALYRDWPVERVRDSARNAFDDLVAAVESLTDQDLANPRRFDWCEGHELADIIPRQSWKHYELHLPSLRQLADRTDT